MPPPSLLLAAFFPALVLLCRIPPVLSFVRPAALPLRAATSRRRASPILGMATPAASAEHLVDPIRRDDQYGRPLDVARYLLDLHDSKATFDFCGGMMFQLVLSDKLREHLSSVVADEGGGKRQVRPFVFDPSMARMFQIPGYDKNADADNVCLFHGREIRKVPDAAGGMGFVLQLSLANANDPEGWTAEEVCGYDGWAHDVGRTWRKGERLEDEGFKAFRAKFGPSAYALHHRFYLHFDRMDRMWLSAEDGCEGTPAQKATSPFAKFFGL